MIRLVKITASLLSVLLLTTCAPRNLPASNGAAVISEGVLPVIEPADAPNNQEPLINHNTYRNASDVDFDVHDLYVKTYPTYNEEGRLITRDEFEKHQAKVRSFNPTLNAHIWQGNPDDPNNRDERLGFNDPEYNCTFLVRGNSTRGAPVKSFKVRLAESGATLFSADSINLLKNYYDVTRTQSKMCMDLMQMLPSGMVSLETKFVRLYINDVQPNGSETGFVDQGLYVWIEQPGKEFLENHGLDINGTIYKPSLFEFTMTPDLRTMDDPLYDDVAFRNVIEPVINPDHAKLIRMLEDVNNLTLDYKQVFDTYFDEENYLTWMAVNVLFGLEDTLTHNLLLYSPSNSEKWYLMPWDYDGALVYSDVEQWGSRFYQQFGVHYFWTLPIHQRYFRIAGNTDKLLAKIDELLATVFTAKTFDELGRGYLKVLDEYMTRAPDSRTQLDYEATRTEVNMRHQAVLNNRERFVLALEYPSTIFMQNPVKVEDGWLFQWDAAFDFQRDPVAYEIILSTGYKYVGADSDSPNGYEQIDVFFQQSGMTKTQLVVPKLPKGPIYYRVLTTDSQGHVQYPRNNAIVPKNDGSGDRWFFRATGYMLNEE